MNCCLQDFKKDNKLVILLFIQINLYQKIVFDFKHYNNKDYIFLLLMLFKPYCFVVDFFLHHFSLKENRIIDKLSIKPNKI